MENHFPFHTISRSTFNKPSRHRRLVLAAPILLPMTVIGANADVTVNPSMEHTLHGASTQQYAKVQPYFEANVGQTSQEVSFLSRGPGYLAYFTDLGPVLMLNGVDSPKDVATTDSHRQPSQRGRLGIRLIGATSNLKPAGEEALPGRVNYFLGKDPEQWRRGVPTYAKVKYENIYPGIDMVFYGSNGQLEYDIIVAPEADPKRILLEFDGVDHLGIAEGGHLLAKTSAGVLTQRAPQAYQEYDGKRTSVSANYIVKGTQVGIALGDYDRKMPLIIDPILSYSTLLGGSAYEYARHITADSTGSAYVVGLTASLNFPTTAGSFQPDHAGGDYDAFVAKLDPSGSYLVYATFLGAGHTDIANAIAVDDTGNAYITGYTSSSDFPTTADAFQANYAGGEFDGFLAKLDASGSDLVYASFWGGQDRTSTWIWSFVVDAMSIWRDKAPPPTFLLPRVRFRLNTADQETSS